ncbi:hypothetical protein ACFQU2_01645 [Siccirubricoccus deserti]
MPGRRHLLAAAGALLACPALAQPIAGGRPIRFIVPSRLAARLTSSAGCWPSG